VENGVDLQYFAPGAARATPYPAEVPVAVFTGAMDYWANVDAVNWFAHAIWPAVRRAVPQAEFWIVGARPGPVVRQLASLPGVVVTGRVPDTRPYLQHARVAVAPLRIARGVQNKVLEAMAMGLAVVATPAACTGIGASAPPCALATDDPALFAARVVAVLADTSAAVGRSYVDAHHDWRRNLVRLADLLEAA
jgi:sugar transferase (PEP-CTERM/EpsH1 system associated)